MPKRDRRPVAIDLFAGVGGFSLGMEQAGFEVALAVEHDPVHAAVYAYNFPHSKVLCADVSKLSGAEIVQALSGWAAKNRADLHWDGKIDLVFGGPPCQGFSVMGKRLPHDLRNNLVFEFCRLVRELQPRYFAMENVPGLCLAKHSLTLEQLMREFEAAGYQLTEPLQVLNAANFGVPQKRRRFFLLGAQIGAVKIDYPSRPLFVNQAPVTVRDAIADLPNLDDFAELNYTDSLQLTPEQLHQLHEKTSSYVQTLREITPDPSNFARRRYWNPELLTSSIQTQHTEASIKRFATLSQGKLEPISRLRRLNWDKPSHTLRAGTGYELGSYTSPRPIHPQYPRVISVREAARLHSFPDWFRFHITKWHGFRQVGNAVPPLLARIIGSQIIEALAVKPSAPTTWLQRGDIQLLKFTQRQASVYWDVLKHPLLK